MIRDSNSNVCKCTKWMSTKGTTIVPIKLNVLINNYEKVWSWMRTIFSIITRFNFFTKTHKFHERRWCNTLHWHMENNHTKKIGITVSQTKFQVLLFWTSTSSEIEVSNFTIWFTYYAMKIMRGLLKMVTIPLPLNFLVNLLFSRLSF